MVKKIKDKKRTRTLPFGINLNSLKSKCSQEEMVGFALIIVLVMVILLIFLWLSLRSPAKQDVESYEVERFIQAFLQYTTNCRNELEYLSVQKLIFACSDEDLCQDGRNSCDVLNRTLQELIEESWKTGDERPVKGYELKIMSNDGEILSFSAGNITNNYEGSMQDFSRTGEKIEIRFTAYY